MMKVSKGIYLLTVREDAGMQEASLEMQLQSMCDGGLLIRCMSSFHIRKKIIFGAEIFARILIFFLSRIIWQIFWDCDDAGTLRPPIAASMLPPPGLSQPDRQEMKRSGLLKPLELMLGWGGKWGCTHLSTAWGAALRRYCAGAPQAATLETFKGREELTGPVSTRR